MRPAPSPVREPWEWVGIGLRPESGLGEAAGGRGGARKNRKQPCHCLPSGDKISTLTPYIPQNERCRFLNVPLSVTFSLIPLITTGV